MAIELTDRLMNIPHAVARRYARRGTNEYDELVGVGNLELVRAARLGPRCGVTDGVYLYGAVKSRVRAASGRYGTGCRYGGRYAPRSEERWMYVVRLGDRAELLVDRSHPWRTVEDRDLVGHFLAMLPVADRAVFVLYRAGELLLREIGELLGFGVTRARHLLLRAEAALARVTS